MISGEYFNGKRLPIPVERGIFMKWFDRMTQDEFRARFGNPSQIAAVKRYTLREGRADGVDAVDVSTGTGLTFTVVPGRGMDIAWLQYDGKPVSYITKGGMSHAAFYESGGFKWLYNFYCGMLTTCGLTQAGDPGHDGRYDLGLHGRVANLPADHVSTSAQWEGDEYVLRVKGTVSDAVIFGENLVMTREIVTKLGSNTLQIRDVVENVGFDKTPFMLMYHMNFGYPVVSENSRLIGAFSPGETNGTPNDPEEFTRFEAPTPGVGEKVFFHQPLTDADGNTAVGIANDELNFGAYIAFNRSQLPCFTQWKMMGAQDYVVGLEPGNCNPLGRIPAREQGKLQYLEPGETHESVITFGILDGAGEIDAFRKKVAQFSR